MSEDWKRIVKQNEIIISLLGRLAFNPDKIRELVMKKKQNPEKYIEGYNACDGNRNVNDLATIVGVTQGTLSPILQEWEELGIIYQSDKPKGKFYKKLFPI
jgi:DNA-binding MarR family transcriptional regulator